MPDTIYMRCNHCGRLTYCRGGFCDDCASYRSASGFSSYTTRPKCTYCNGTGKVTHMFGPDTPCPQCGGSGKM